MYNNTTTSRTNNHSGYQKPYFFDQKDSDLTGNINRLRQEAEQVEGNEKISNEVKEYVKGQYEKAKEELVTYRLNRYLSARKEELPTMNPDGASLLTLKAWATYIVRSKDIASAVELWGSGGVVSYIALLWWNNEVPARWTPFYEELVAAFTFMYGEAHLLDDVVLNVANQ